MTAPRFERDDLVRMIPFDASPSDTVLRADDDGDGKTLVGYAAVFDTWTEIHSWEGDFKERIQRGAFKRTLKNNRAQIKVLFNHGMDPSIGDKPLGKPRTMKEDTRGLFIEVPLDETSYNADLTASLRSGALDGMSFRMNVIRDQWDKLDTSLPERTIQEIRLFEFGPVTFPAYEATEAGVRAHAPEAFAAFRSAKQAPRESEQVEADTTVEECAQCAARAAAGPSVQHTTVGETGMWTPVPAWPGWSLTPPATVTTTGTATTPSRDAPPSTDDAASEVTEPDDTVEVRDTNDADETTGVESDSDTMALTGDSPDSGHPPSRSDDSVDPDHTPDPPDDPTDSGHSSEPEEDAAPPRTSAVRKAIFVDTYLGWKFDEEMDVADTRYSHLMNE